MVRANGQRAPEPDHVVLAEVVPATGDRPVYAEELAYFGEGPLDSWIVRLNRIHHVRPVVLDLCVFNATGEASVVDGAPVPQGLRPSLVKRHEILRRLFTRAMDKLSLFAEKEGDTQAVKETKRQLMTRVGEELLKESPFKAVWTNTAGTRSLAYNCRRVARLSRTRALPLLMAYTSCMNRPAFEREFGVPLRKSRAETPALAD